MDAGAILHRLTHAQGLPREALKAASAQRAEMLPLFLNEIEAYLALEPAARVKPTPLFFIFHLLGEWRERAAFAGARLFRAPPPLHASVQEIARSHTIALAEPPASITNESKFVHQRSLLRAVVAGDAQCLVRRDYFSPSAISGHKGRRHRPNGSLA